jgi:hypothetical protein
MTVSISLLHIEERHKGQNQKIPDISGHKQDTRDKRRQTRTILDKTGKQGRKTQDISDIHDRDRTDHQTANGDLAAISIVAPR